MLFGKYRPITLARLTSLPQGKAHPVQTVVRTGESSPVHVSEALATKERQRLPLGEGGFPSAGNWRTRRGERVETVIVPLKVQYKSTPNQVTPRRQWYSTDDI